MQEAKSLSLKDARRVDVPTEMVRDLQLVGARCFVRAVRRTSNLVTRVYNSYFKALGIEATQFWILCAIAASSANSATELADILGVEKSTLKRGLDRMIDGGLIVSAPGDGRRVIHRLTDLGTERLNAALPLWHEAQAEMEQHLPTPKADEIRQGLRLLRRRARSLLEVAD